MPLERLQKIISQAGLTSRRQAEQWILDGRVCVNGTVIRELGSKADLAVHHIQVDGKALRPQRRLVYIALHKPREIMSTRSDPQGRPTIMNFLKAVPERVYPVGRLDFASEGLLLLTNDGDFSQKITAAASGIPKTYWVKVSGAPKENDLEQLRRGVRIEGRRTLPARIRLLNDAERKLLQTGRRATTSSWYEVVLHEGRQNQIRRMFERIGHSVRKLRRVRIGILNLENLAPGQFRYLTPAEVQRLTKVAPSRDIQRTPDQETAHPQKAQKAVRETDKK